MEEKIRNLDNLIKVYKKEKADQMEYLNNVIDKHKFEIA